MQETSTQGNFSSSLGFAIGLSLSSIVGASMLTDTLHLPAYLAAFAGMGIAVFFIVKNGFAFSKRDFYLLLFAILPQTLMVLAHFAKYPIFPQFDSVDFGEHAVLVRDYVSNGAPVASLPFYYGVIMVLASFSVLSPPPYLIQTREIMGVLSVLSTFVLYYCVKALTGRERAALFSSMIYAITGFVWFGMVFNSGLYPNFYGVMASFFLIGTAANFTRTYSKWSFVFLALAFFNAAMSHYSTIFLIGAVAGYLSLYSLYRRRFFFAGLFGAPIVLASSALLSSTGRAFIAPFFDVNGIGNPIGNGTYLADLIGKNWPVMSFVFNQFQNDVGAALLLVLAGLATLALRKSVALSILFAWLGLSLAIAPWGYSAWRFAFISLAPITLLSGIGLDRLGDISPFRPWLQHFGKQRFSRLNKKFALFSFLIVSSSAYNSWGMLALLEGASPSTISQGTPMSISDARTYSPYELSTFSDAQHQVYDASLWLVANSPPNAVIVAATDWRFKFLPALAPASSHLSPIYAPNDLRPLWPPAVPDPYQVLLYAHKYDDPASISHGLAHYIVITNLMTEDVKNPVYVPWLTYNSRNLNGSSLVYNSTDVRIWKLP